MLKISGAIPLLPKTPVWRGQKQILGLRILQKRVCICIEEVGSKSLEKSVERGSS
jgi:hypothetical protein